LSLFFVAGVITFIIVAAVTKQYGFFGGAIVFYICHLIETCCSSTNRYLKNVESSTDAWKIIEKVKRTAPVIRFHIQNYHHELRTRTVRVA